MINRRSPRLPRLNGKWYSSPHSQVVVVVNCCLLGIPLLNQVFSDIKVIPLYLFYYQTFFETWRNEHS